MFCIDPTKNLKYSDQLEVLASLITWLANQHHPHVFIIATVQFQQTTHWPNSSYSGQFVLGEKSSPKGGGGGGGGGGGQGLVTYGIISRIFAVAIHASLEPSIRIISLHAAFTL